MLEVEEVGSERGRGWERKRVKAREVEDGRGRGESERGGDWERGRGWERKRVKAREIEAGRGRGWKRER